MEYAQPTKLACMHNVDYIHIWSRITMLLTCNQLIRSLCAHNLISILPFTTHCWNKHRYAHTLAITNSLTKPCPLFGMMRLQYAFLSSFPGRGCGFARLASYNYSNSYSYLMLMWPVHLYVHAHACAYLLSLPPFIIPGSVPAQVG